MRHTLETRARHCSSWHSSRRWPDRRSNPCRSDWTSPGTFSILGFDPETGEVGGAVQSRVFSVGNGVLWAEAGVGAVATQAAVDVGLRAAGHGASARGHGAEGHHQEGVGRRSRHRSVVQEERPSVRGHEHEGRVAAFTGPRRRSKPATRRASGAPRRATRSDGPIDVWPPADGTKPSQVPAAMVEGFEKSEMTADGKRNHLAMRLLMAIEAGQAAGGDHRGQESVALIVVKKDCGVWPHNDVELRLQVDDSPEPIKEMRRLVEKALAPRSGQVPCYSGERAESTTPPAFARPNSPAPSSGSTCRAADAEDAARQGRAARFLDVRLHQLHAHPARPQASRGEVPATRSSSSASTRRSSRTSASPRTSAGSSCATTSTHPVANDAAFAIWKAYGARAWPTQVLIDPEGYVVGDGVGRREGRGVRPGDRGRDPGLRRAGRDRSHAAAAVARARARCRPRRWRFPARCWPTRRLAGLFIADSNHHRVLVADARRPRHRRDRRRGDVGRDGRRVRGGAVLSAAGPRARRRACSTSRTRRTTSCASPISTARSGRDVAGTGRQAALGRRRRRGAGDGAQLAVGSATGGPTAVRRDGGHASDLDDRSRARARVSVRGLGPRGARRRPGRRGGVRAAVRPGARRRDTLYVADSESNIIRAIALPPDERRAHARRRRPLRVRRPRRRRRRRATAASARRGVAGGRLFIADTYNHRIKVLDPRTRR